MSFSGSGTIVHSLNGTMGQEPQSEDWITVNMDILIIGTGPAGASLACFLASHGKSS